MDEADPPALTKRDIDVLEQVIKYHRDFSGPVEASTLGDIFEWENSGNGNPKVIYRLKKLKAHGLVEQ